MLTVEILWGAILADVTLAIKAMGLHAEVQLSATGKGIHSKNEGMKHIPKQYDSHTFSFHTMGTKEAFILL